MEEQEKPAHVVDLCGLSLFSSEERKRGRESEEERKEKK